MQEESMQVQVQDRKVHKRVMHKEHLPEVESS
jgi:hypothetical protein